MSKRESYEQRTEAILLPILEKHGFSLWDVEYVKEGGNWYLRAYIDKPDGIGVNDCEVVSRELSDILDEEDYIEGSYILEVSSPGLGRQLKKEKDFKRSIGEDVDVKFYKAVKIPNPRNGKEMSVKQITGMLKEFEKDTITLETDFANEYVINRKDISTVKLTIDF